MIYPNLFVIGATKCGTTSLHSWLNLHPDIQMSRVKEPGYFLGPEAFHPVIRNLGSTPDEWHAAYLSLFESLESQPRFAGTSSTAYTHFPHRNGIAQRVHAYNPQARLIYVMRDPIERTISHYWWNVRFEGENRSLIDAIAADKRYRDVSNYAMQIKEWLRHFDMSDMKVLTLEELSAAPADTLAGIFRWLEVDDSCAAQCVLKRKNETPEVLTRTRSKFWQRLRYSTLWSVVGPAVPARVRLLGRRMAEQIVQRSPTHDQEVEEFLRPSQLAQVGELSELLQRDFPEWRRLYAGATSIARRIASNCVL